MVYNLNYITCSDIWGTEKGLKMIKYYDTQIFFSMLTSCLLNFIFPGEKNIHKIFRLFMFGHVISLFLLFIFQKKK